MTNLNKNNSKPIINNNPKSQDKNNSNPLLNSIKDSKSQLNKDLKSFTPPNSLIEENENSKKTKK